MAVAYGSAAAALPGSALPTPAQIDLNAVRVYADLADSRHPVTTDDESIAMTSSTSCRSSPPIWSCSTSTPAATSRR